MKNFKTVDSFLLIFEILYIIQYSFLNDLTMYCLLGIVFRVRLWQGSMRTFMSAMNSNIRWSVDPQLGYDTIVLKYFVLLWSYYFIPSTAACEIACYIEFAFAIFSINVFEFYRFDFFQRFNSIRFKSLIRDSQVKILGIENNCDKEK